MGYGGNDGNNELDENYDIDDRINDSKTLCPTLSPTVRQRDDKWLTARSTCLTLVAR